MGFLDRFTKKKDEHNFEERGEHKGPDKEPEHEELDLPKEVLIKPGRIKMEFLVKPDLEKEDREKLERGITYSSGLARYYRFSIDFEKNYKVGKTRVTVTCVEPLVPVERSEEVGFYSDVKEFFSTWLIEALKYIGYQCELYNWRYGT